MKAVVCRLFRLFWAGVRVLMRIRKETPRTQSSSSAYRYSKKFPPSQKKDSLRYFPLFSSTRATIHLQKDKNYHKYAYFCLRPSILDRFLNAIFNGYKIVARIVYSKSYSRRICMV
ncbi:MAG: hypothetical protein ACR2K1_05805, partial [Saprospiraceae bacterium]